MRIVYLWDADYPWDVRTEKVCAALTAAGHEVHVVARNRRWRPLLQRLPEGTVHRMRPWRLLGKRLDGALGFPAFASPRWLGLLAGTVREVRPAVIVARDLPLCPTAVWVGRRSGVPVVFDMAENYPAMLRSTRAAGRQRRWDRLLRNPSLAEAVESWCLPRVDRVVTVVRESAERVHALGVPAERISVVSNTPPRERALRAPMRPAPAGTEPLRVVYLGLMEVPRGVGELLEAAALLARRGVAARLTLIGDGRDLPLFRERARALGLEEAQVEFTGYLPNAQALARVAGADVGVVPHHADEAWNTTVPNKLFDYMAAGVPVVGSDAAPCRRILEETGAGLVFRAGDAAGLAEAVTALADPAARAALSAAGRAAVLERYNWESDSSVLTRVIEEVAGDGAGAAAGRRSIPIAAKTIPPAIPTATKARK